MSGDRVPRNGVGAISLLYVEDDRDQRIATKFLLESRGYHVETAQGVEEAKRLLERGGFQALITDYQLLDGTAADFLFDVSMPPDRILVLTGLDQPVVPPGTRVIRKPFDLEWLLDLLGTVVRPGTPPVVAFLPPEPAARAKPGSCPIEVVLYLAGESETGKRARENLLRAVAAQPKGRVDASIHDVMKDLPLVHGADPALFLPTLVRRRPRPRVWIVGDLSSTEDLMGLFGESSPLPGDPDAGKPDPAVP